MYSINNIAPQIMDEYDEPLDLRIEFSEDDIIHQSLDPIDEPPAPLVQGATPQLSTRNLVAWIESILGEFVSEVK